MDFAEHQRIAFDALQLLAGNLAVPDNAAGNKLKQLKEAYGAGDEDDVLYISKGIHQPETNPHMQLQLKRGKSNWYTFHLNVSVSDPIQGLPEDYFHWVGTQFVAEANTVPNGRVTACWPVNAAHDGKSRHSRRRWSIAPADVQDTIEAIERKRREEQEEADRKEQTRLAQEQARLAQQNKELLRKKIAAQLTTNSWTISGNKNTELDKLIAGKTIAVKTKTGKTINVKFEDGKIKQA